MSDFDMEYLGRTIRVAIEDAFLNAQENKAKPTRDEIALRFAVALAGGDWACPNEMNSPSAEVARLSFEYADAFIAARDGAR